MKKKLRLESIEFKLIDLFCGCGGFTEGFLFQQTEGGPKWKAMLAIDIDAYAIDTYKENFGEKICRQANLLDAEPNTYLKELRLKSGDLDHLHASPPCQAYSVNNRKNSHNQDYRFRKALDWVEIFQPKVFSMENVRNLGEAHDSEIRKKLLSLGYKVISFKVDSADYGVPQHRKRLFYLACLVNLGIKPFPPEPTHTDVKVNHNGLKAWVNVRQAISDLPVREAGMGPEKFISKMNPEDPADQSRLSEYASIMRPPKGEQITGHLARPLNDLALRRIKSLSPGEAIWNLPQDLRPKMGFRGAYGRLHPDYPSDTITTGVRGPSHGQFSHYNQDRLITIREAARLQSFPDSFVFKGSRSSQACQIGNAVPPLVAKAIRNVSEQILSKAQKV